MNEVVNSVKQLDFHASCAQEMSALLFAAMVQHVGHAKKQGHYLIYVAEDMINHVDSKVLCDDDSHVFETTWSHIASREAYMLAYIRRD